MKINLIIILLTLSLNAVFSQDRTLPVDTMVITTHSSIIKGQSVSYTAETGMQPVWDKEDKVIASLYYTYYTRNNVKSVAERPLVFSFNGGPGSASVWMHLAYTGPKVLNIDSEGYPLQPYGYKDNPNSILDIADIVYVNPVNTAYSRIIGEGEEKPDQKTVLWHK